MIKRLNLKQKKSRFHITTKSAQIFYKRKSSLLGVGISLFSHPVARALSSAPQSLTSVFGMGTGGPSASSTQKNIADSKLPNWAQTSDIMIKLMHSTKNIEQ